MIRIQPSDLAIHKAAKIDATGRVYDEWIVVSGDNGVESLAITLSIAAAKELAEQLAKFTQPAATKDTSAVEDDRDERAKIEEPMNTEEAPKRIRYHCPRCCFWFSNYQRSGGLTRLSLVSASTRSRRLWSRYRHQNPRWTTAASVDAEPTRKDT